MSAAMSKRFVTTGMPLADRLMFCICVDLKTKCWNWLRSQNGWGYGQISIPGTGKNIGAHRASWLTFRGPIPAGMQIDHLCRNRLCINPDHLEVVSSRENTMRGESPTAKNAAKGHCPAGHEYAEANLYLHNGRRHCRICRRQARLRHTPLINKKVVAMICCDPGNFS